jgi:hypothetical protein
MLSLLALLLHAALLSDLNWTWAALPAAPRVVAMQVRTLVDAAAPKADPLPMLAPRLALADPAAEPAADPAADTPPARAAAPKRAEPKLARPAVAPAVAPTKPPTESPAEPPATLVAIAPKPRIQPPPAPASAVPGDDEIPHYRTQMPHAATLRYQVSKGMLHGTGELRWNPQGDHYEITLESKLAGMTLLTQVSSGVFDADGIAPLRFSDTRLRRSTVAANFRRDAGKISFSGAGDEFPLWPGVQDRVSWMVQLAAIVAAQPELRVPGAKVAMHVVGANADASVWAFKCVGNEAVRTDLGPVDALKYVREPRGPYDTTAQAWLDPTHHFLPARATLRSGANDEGYELRLQDVSGTP